MTAGFIENAEEPLFEEESLLPQEELSEEDAANLLAEQKGELKIAAVEALLEVTGGQPSDPETAKVMVSTLNQIYGEPADEGEPASSGVVLAQKATDAAVVSDPTYRKWYTYSVCIGIRPEGRAPTPLFSLSEHCRGHQEHGDRGPGAEEGPRRRACQAGRQHTGGDLLLERHTHTHFSIRHSTTQSLPNPLN